MELYRPNHQTLHAHQVTGSRLLDGTIKNINPERIVIQMTDRCQVATQGGHKIAKIGDWIVRLSDGSLIVFEHHIFKLLYHKF